MTKAQQAFIQAFTDDERNVKHLATVTYNYIEDIIRRDRVGVTRAIQLAHIELAETHAIKRSVATLARYHAVAVWLMSQTQSVHWIDDRTFSQHDKAMHLGWTRARLLREDPNVKRNGFMGPKGALTRINAGLTEITNGLRILDVEIDVSKGSTRRGLLVLRDLVKPVPSMRNEFIEAIQLTF